MSNHSEVIRVGVVGTGYVSRHFVLAFDGKQGIQIARVLTRRPLESCVEFPRPHILTHSLSDLVEHADIVFECTGDPIHATDVVHAACLAGRPVVTINAEFHVTAGSYFVGKGLITEAPGDQPGSIALLREHALSMGFRPLVLGNLKAFLNHDPTLEEMTYWGGRNGITLDKVTSFTDGTKLQIEQALVANGLDATIACPGLIGPRTPDLDAAGRRLAGEAKKLGQAISDYVLFPGAPHGVFVVCEHDEEQREFLRHMKMGDGPYYVLMNRDVLVHLEVGRIIHRVMAERRGLLDNSAVPTITVASIAKRDIRAGTHIDKGMGSFDLRGVAVKIEDHPGALPIGLAQRVVVNRNVMRGEVLSMDDVDIPESLALRAWSVMERRSLAMESEIEETSSTA